MKIKTPAENKKNTQMQNKIWVLAFTTAIVAVLFSFMGAPFLRALSAKARPALFWGVGATIVVILFSVQLTLGAIYLGSVWTTLGAYNELEKRGFSWKKTSLTAILSGAFFATASYFMLRKSSLKINLAEQLTNPFLQALRQMNPNEKATIEQITQFMPGVLMAALTCSLAVGFVFESKIFQLFQLKREKIISSLKWLDFRLPDQFIWFALSGFLFSVLRTDFFLVAQSAEKIKTIAINISIFSAVVFFLQGVTVFEYLNRFYRVSTINKCLMYLLIFIWLAPAMAAVGLIDYWADFRKRVRKNLSQKA